MWRSVARVGLALAAFGLTYLVAEGVVSISQGRDPEVSLALRAARALQGEREKPRFYRPVLTDPGEIVPLLRLFEQNGVAVGNSDYDELRTEAARMNDDGACLVQRSDLRKEFTFLRTPLFNPFNPLSVFYDAERSLPSEVRHFIDTFAVRKTIHSTNAHGERTTLPRVTRETKVIVAGDSVALGAMVNDVETLASTLQTADRSRQYVNLGIGGAHARDIRCALEAAAERYPRQIERLIYVYCENDFQEGVEFGTPEELVAWLRQYVAENGIADTVVVYAPYIYNVVPEFTRHPGQRGEHHDDHADEKQRLVSSVRDSGFGWVDFGLLALAESDSLGSRHAPLSLYVDIVHLSPLGTERLAEALRALESD